MTRFMDRWGYRVAIRRDAPSGRFRPLAHAIAGALMLVAQTGWVLAQSAAILPQAKTQFLDQNGKPLVGGKVFTFVPNTTVPKTTWSDAFQANPNTNPIVLDAAGSAFIFGQGNYLQQLYDANNNLKWFGFTSAPGTSVPTGGSAQDTAPIGTVVPFAGSSVPTNWLLAFGQAISRTTYAQLLATLTIQTTAGVCNLGSPNIGGFGSTSQIAVGQPVEASCLPGGTTVLSIVNSSTIQASANANASTTVTATVFPWGNGNGVNTFNVPDLRGRTVAGADAMGGTAASRLTSTFYGTGAGAPGAAGGAQSQTIAQANLPNVNFTNSGITLNDPGHTHQLTYAGVTGSSVTVASAGAQSIGGSGNPQAFNNTLSVVSATTGITVSSQGHAASGGSGTAFATVQPTLTTNYIIKALPATSGAGGVVSLGGMFGDIVCDSSMTCATVGGVNTIGVNFPVSVAKGGTGQTSFTANLPIVGNGSGALAQGTVSGSGTKFATVTGSLSNGNCITASGGNLVDGGAPCVSATSGVSAGNAGQLAGYAVNGSIVSGFSPGIPITRAQIPTITANLQQFTVTGFRTAGDLGAGAVYNCVGQTANSLMAIQDASSNWCALVLQGKSNVGWFGAYADDGSHKISAGDLTANPSWRGIYSPGFNFTASLSGQTLTVTATSGVLGPQQSISGGGLNAGAYIIKQLTGSTGSTGTYKVSVSQTLASATMSSNQQTWDYAATQEAIYAAFATNSTPKTVVWNAPNSTNTLNATLVIPAGNFGINAQILMVATNFSVFGAGKGLSTWDWVGPAQTIMVLCNSCTYGNWYNPSFTNSQSQPANPGSIAAGYGYTSGVPLFDLDHTVDTPGGLSTQQLSFYDMLLSVSFNGIGFAGNYIAGNGGQGDTVKFFNPILIGNMSSVGMLIVGDNTLDWGIYGGDCQGFYYKCIEAPGGSIQVYNMNFENETNTFGFNSFAPVMGQVQHHGADIGLDWGVGPETSGAHMVRSESMIGVDSQFSSNFSYVENFVVSGSDNLGYFTGFGGYQVGNIVATGTKGWSFMLVDNSIDGGGNQSWHSLSPTVIGCCTVTDPSASYTVNGLINFQFAYRFGSNGFFQRCGITANTATTITVSSAGCIQNPVPSTSLYTIIVPTSGTPNWDAIPAGHSTTNEGSAFGFYTVAGNTHIGMASNAAMPGVGDYVVIPGADILDPGSGAPNFIQPLYTKVTATSGSPCPAGGGISSGCITVTRAPAFTLNDQFGYFGAVGVDPVNTTVKWMMIDFATFRNLGAGSVLSLPQGGRVAGGNLRFLQGVTYSRSDWFGINSSATPGVSRAGALDGQVTNQFPVGLGNVSSPLNLTLTGTMYTNLIAMTVTGDTVINFPPIPGGGLNPEYTLAVGENTNTPAVVSWGTNVEPTTRPIVTDNTLTPTGVTYIKFRPEASAPGLWSEVSRSTDGVQNFRLASPFSAGNNTLATITGFSAHVGAGQNYRFNAKLYVTSMATAGGTQVALAGTATATNVIYTGAGYDTSNVLRGYSQATSLGTSVANTAGWNGTNTVLMIDGTITVNAAGTLLLQFAQNTNNGTASVLGAGSTFTVTPIQ